MSPNTKVGYQSLDGVTNVHSHTIRYIGANGQAIKQRKRVEALEGMLGIASQRVERKTWKGPSLQILDGRSMHQLENTEEWREHGDEGGRG